MPKTMVPNVNESHGSIDPQHLQVKISLGATIPWSSKFFKLIHDARGNHVVAL